MAAKINDIKISPTRKRIDANVRVTSFWSEPYEIKIRILSRVELPEGQEEELIEQIVERKSEWKKCKVNCSLSLNGIDANAYIIEQKKEEENEGE